MNSYLSIIFAVSMTLGSPTMFAGEPAEGGETPATELNGEPADTTYNELDEFVLTVKKELIKSDGEKLTYDLEQDDTSKGLSVLDALRKVPMVSVDGQDNIRVKGDSGFKIYVNGKEEPMLTANASKILKAMPSESVSKIEVITEPGAKYDAEGTGGIINLITERKQRKDGYTGSLSLNAGPRNEGASAYGRVKYDRFTADANINYSDNFLSDNTTYNHEETLDYTSAEAYGKLTDMRQKFGFYYLGGGLNLSWEPTDKDLFTVSGNVYSVSAKIKELNVWNTIFDRSGAETSSFAQKGFGKLEHLGATGSASYKRTFNDSRHSLIASYAFHYGKNFMDVGYNNEDIMNAAFLPGAQDNKSDILNREHTATLDYTLPLGEKHSVETGAKGIFRRNTASSSQFIGTDSDNLTEVAEDASLTAQIQDVYALYASYGGMFGKFSLKAGLRYEHTYMGMDFRKGMGENYRRHLDDVVPNGSLTYLLGPASNLRLAYQMRIRRPGLSEMNPFKFQIYQGQIRMGNPDLESEKYHNLSLTYTNFGRVLGGNISLEASTSDNTIENFKYFEDNILYDTYANMGHKNSIALNGFLTCNITNDMSLGVNGSVNYTTIRSGDRSLGNHGWNGNYGANFNYTGPWKIKYGVYGGQSTGNINLQGKWYGWYYYGLGITRSFLKEDALTLSLNAQNFFTKFSHYKSITETETHRQTSNGKNANWNVGISISWNFGQLKEQVKKTGANLENEDIKSDSKNQGGGISL